MQEYYNQLDALRSRIYELMEEGIDSPRSDDIQYYITSVDTEEVEVEAQHFDKGLLRTYMVKFQKDAEGWYAEDYVLVIRESDSDESYCDYKRLPKEVRKVIEEAHNLEVKASDLEEHINEVEALEEEMSSMVEATKITAAPNKELEENSLYVNLKHPNEVFGVEIEYAFIEKLTNSVNFGLVLNGGEQYCGLLATTKGTKIIDDEGSASGKIPLLLKIYAIKVAKRYL